MAPDWFVFLQPGIKPNLDRNFGIGRRFSPTSAVGEFFTYICLTFCLRTQQPFNDKSLRPHCNIVIVILGPQWRQKPRPRFLSNESLGSCFSHGMGDHDQILHQTHVAVNLLSLIWNFGSWGKLQLRVWWIIALFVTDASVLLGDDMGRKPFQFRNDVHLAMLWTIEHRTKCAHMSFVLFYCGFIIGLSSYVINSPIFFGVVSIVACMLATILLPRTIEVTLKHMGKINHYLTKTIREPLA